MATGRKTGGRDFKKGQPGGPGKPRTPPEIKAIQESSKELFVKALENTGKMSIEEAKAFMLENSGKDGAANKANLIQAYFVSAMVQAYRDPAKGQRFIDSIMDRIVGPVKKKVELEGEVSLQAQIVKAMKEVEDED